MKIAVAGQNRRTVTGHTGRCRKFWLYGIEEGQVQDRILLELPKEQSLHDKSPHEPHRLADADVLISGGMGQGLIRRLGAWGIEAVVTSETDPDRVVAQYVAGTLPQGLPPESHGHQYSCHGSDTGRPSEMTGTKDTAEPEARLAYFSISRLAMVMGLAGRRSYGRGQKPS